MQELDKRRPLHGDIMDRALRVSIGQYSSAGRKPLNQDHHGWRLPSGTLLATKGLALAVADGISSSDVSQEASRAAVQGFLTDYFDTSEAWSVKHSASAVISALNAWLHAQNRRGPHGTDLDRGRVCTFSALIFKSRTAHLLHVGDSRIYRLLGHSLEQLTQDHRVQVSNEQSYLARALGMAPHVDIDYKSLPVEAGDIFLLTTDGAHDFIDGSVVAQALAAHPDDLDQAAHCIADAALARGSADNVTCQLAKVVHLAEGNLDELHQQAALLAIPPLLDARASFEGYTILRPLHSSHRSHIYLAKDELSAQTVVIKAPSIDLLSDPEQLDRFLLEEWIARRVNSAHVLKPVAIDRPRQHIFAVMEHVEGQTLAQWMRDHPRPDLEMVRNIIEQIAKGLQAFHRMEMLHQDLRPENVMIDREGTVKIIDFGSVHVAGIAECAEGKRLSGLIGTLQFAAPEYFLGEAGTPRSDLFSLAVITYLMLTGRLPYGGHVARLRTSADLNRIQYVSALSEHSTWPGWIDEVLHKALQAQAARRHEAVSEFVHELRHPPARYLTRRRAALMERNPLLFWKTACLLLLLAVMALLARVVLQ